MSKTVSQAMKYEVTGNKKSSDKQVALQAAEIVGTPSLIWLLIKRHKVGLLAIGNVILLLNWAVPMWTEIVKSIF